MEESANVSMLTTIGKLKAAQKNSHGSSLYLAYVNRPLGRLLAACAFRLRLTPNGVSALGGIITYAACIAVAFWGEHFPVAVIVVASLLLGYALDSADGQLARLQGQGSLAGELLDRLLDTAKLILIHVAVVITLVRELSSDLPHVAYFAVGVGVIFMLSTSVLAFASVLRKELLRRTEVKGTAPNSTASSEAKSMLKGTLYLIKEYGVLCLSLLLLPLPASFLSVYSLLTLGTLLFTCIFLVKWYREFYRIDLERQSKI